MDSKKRKKKLKILIKEKSKRNFKNGESLTIDEDFAGVVFISE